MEHLFFNLNGSFEEVVKRSFAAMGVSNYQEGNSANVLNGVYSSVSLFGMMIKLEENSYGFEDNYAYMISVKEDFLSSLKVDDSLSQPLALLVARMLSDNLGIPVAQETPKGLAIIEGSQ